jgi:hypothetical protein
VADRFRRNSTSLAASCGRGGWAFPAARSLFDRSFASLAPAPVLSRGIGINLRPQAGEEVEKVEKFEISEAHRSRLNRAAGGMSNPQVRLRRQRTWAARQRRTVPTLLTRS